jgi:opacity protein-like surface antigen
MASALARALAVADMSKAGRQDVEMLTRLVVEFKDELDALGVRTDQLDGRVSGLHNRLGGWQISGALVMDVEGWRRDDETARTNIAQARLFIDRRFGENDDIRFHARLRNDGGTVRGSNSAEFHRFWVEFPLFFDTVVTVGRFNLDWDWPYNFYTLGISDLGNWSWITDWGAYDGFMLTRNFSIGRFQMYVSRAMEGPLATVMEPMHIAAIANLEFTERLGVDIGIQYLHGDDATEYHHNDGAGNWDRAFRLDNVNTLFGGVRFNLNQNIGLRGIYYHQRFRGERAGAGSAAAPVWENDHYTSHAYKLVLDVNQDLLGFTGLWLGYDFMQAGFMATGGGNGGFDPADNVRNWALDRFEHDMRTWRVGAIQQWSAQWLSWVYFAHHTFIDVECGGNLMNPTGLQWGIGVEYLLNANVGFALNYIRSDFDNAVTWMGNNSDNHLIRFRTMITF